MVVAFLGNKTSDGKQAYRSHRGVAVGFWGKSIQSAARENDLHRRAARAFAEIRDARCGGRVNETGGAKFGFEKLIAPPAINIIGVAAEAERDAAEPAEYCGGRGGSRRPD